MAGGRDQDRPRVKVTTVPEMLAIIRGEQSPASPVYPNAAQKYGCA